MFHPGYLSVRAWLHVCSTLVTCLFHPGYLCVPPWLPVCSTLVTCVFHPGYLSVRPWLHVCSTLVTCLSRPGYLSVRPTVCLWCAADRPSQQWPEADTERHSHPVPHRHAPLWRTPEMDNRTGDTRGLVGPQQWHDLETNVLSVCLRWVAANRQRVTSQQTADQVMS